MNIVFCLTKVQNQPSPSIIPAWFMVASATNPTGDARLDAYFDPNERKYFITLKSLELAIAEEQTKAVKLNASEAWGIIV